MLHRALCPQAAHMPCLHTQPICHACTHSTLCGSLTNMICWWNMLSLALPQAAATRCCAVSHTDNMLTGRYYDMTARWFWRLQNYDAWIQLRLAAAAKVLL
jgi:hypothetical protein